MKRSEWNRWLPHEDSLVEIDLSDTPLHALLSATDIVGTFAERSQEGKALITVIRNDPDDFPNAVIIDRHEVWEQVELHVDLEATVKAASTKADERFVESLSDYVFIVPAPKGEDH